MITCIIRKMSFDINIVMKKILTALKKKTPILLKILLKKKTLKGREYK